MPSGPPAAGSVKQQVGQSNVAIVGNSKDGSSGHLDSLTKKPERGKIALPPLSGLRPTDHTMVTR